MKDLLRRAAITGVIAVAAISIATPASAFFPGQDRVAFVRYDGTDPSVRTMDWDGSGMKTPLKDPGSGLPRFLSASLSPDGTKILYSKIVGSTDNIDLYVKTIGGGSQRITNTPGLWEYSATWSPTGKKIVYAETDNDSYGSIVVSKADGSTHVAVATSIVSWVWYPTWSPDGTQLAYSVSDGTDLEVIVSAPVADAKGAPITTNDVDDYAGDWSPNGSRIAFIRPVGTPRAPTFAVRDPRRALAPHGVAAAADLITVRADGTNPFPVTTDGKAVGRAAYAPHQTILLSRLAHVSLDLYSVSTGGGSFTRLTRTGETYNTVDMAFYFVGA